MSAAGFSLAFAFAAVTLHAETKASNNNFGSYDKKPDTLTIGVIIGNVVVNSNFVPYSAIVAQDARIRDDAFDTLLVQNLGAGTNRTFDSLLIVMNQCYGGGFINNIERDMNTTMIATAARWNKTALASGDGTFGFYSRSWLSQFADPAPPKLADDTKMKPAYSGATVGDARRNKEIPQYYATSDFMDNDYFGSSADKTFALIFVGDDHYKDKNGVVTRDPGDWNDSVLMRKRLLQRGYTAANTYVYYCDGTKPPAAQGDMPIDGKATVANFNDFFNNVLKNNVAGKDDQIFIWICDHGVQILEFTGKIRFVPIDADNRITMRLDLTQDTLLSMTTGAAYGDALLSGDPLSNVVAPVTVSIGDALGSNVTILGTITNETAWSLNIPSTVFDTLAPLGGTNGSITLLFEGGSAITELNNFSLSSEAQLEKSNEVNPIPLNFQQDGANLILSWPDPEFVLQSAPAASGTYTNISGATSPFTNAVSGPTMFFRLKAN